MREWDKNKYQRCKALGLCHRCGKSLDQQRAHCSACSEVLREYRKKTAHIARDRSSRWRESNIERDRQNHRWNKIERAYNLKKEQYEMLARLQDYKCAICRIDISGQPGQGHGPCVDHRHSDGLVRGLLCHDCNRGLGNFKDNAAFLEAALRYLKS